MQLMHFRIHIKYFKRVTEFPDRKFTEPATYTTQLRVNNASFNSDSARCYCNDLHRSVCQ